jgi:hypothetical protein
VVRGPVPELPIPDLIIIFSPLQVWSMSSCPFKLVASDSGFILNLNCLECRKNKNSEPGNCIDDIIATVEKQMNITDIILNNYKLIKLQPEAVDIIKQFANISRLISNMSERITVEKSCRSCDIKPSIFFFDLDCEMSLKPEVFIQQLKNCLTLLVKKSADPALNEKCEDCICESYKDLTFLFLNYKSLSKKIIKDGFSVVID